MTIWSVDLDGRLTSANRFWSQFAEQNGAAAIAAESAVVGCSVFESVADDASRDQIERAMTLLRHHRVPVVRWEFPCNSPTEERVFLMQVTALQSGADVTGFVFCTVDITSSHRSREALIDTGNALAETIVLDRVYEEVARQLRRAVPSNGFVIALLDEESTNFRITHKHGYEHVAADAVSLELRLTPMWAEAAATRQVCRSDSEVGLEITVPLMTSEGVRGALTLCAEPFESMQRLEAAQRVVVVIAAQTAVAIERARLVQRVEQKRRLEAIGEVAAGVAHELRNPLFGISSAAQLLQLRSAEDSVVEKNVGRILREVERLSRMVTSLLEFGRPHPVRLQLGDPDAVWDDILDGERARLESKRLTIHRVRQPSASRCLLDAEQLGQVFRNVLANACDASPVGAALQLQSQSSPSGGWRCRVSNGGLAIPSDVLPHVFEFFFSTKVDGTGIGLALCQRIMDEHGGTINIESTPEVGTTLTLTLPAGIAS